MKRHIKYLQYVLKHKWFVFQECLKLGVPLWIAILHDWDKFLPDEWLPYARTFYKSNGEKQYDPDESFAKAWLLHQNRNKHHWQYWMITWDKGNTECLPMPRKYLLEMIADWRGAGRAITGGDNTLAWYRDNYNNIQLHHDTRCELESILLNRDVWVRTVEEVGEMHNGDWRQTFDRAIRENV